MRGGAKKYVAGSHVSSHARDAANLVIKKAILAAAITMALLLAGKVVYNMASSKVDFPQPRPAIYYTE